MSNFEDQKMIPEGQGQTGARRAGFGWSWPGPSKSILGYVVDLFEVKWGLFVELWAGWAGTDWPWPASEKINSWANLGKGKAVVWQGWSWLALVWLLQITPGKLEG
ncbi:hypothetical protein BY996DRAFT_6595713 [Phakopsora pachyrhizi]|nr:hypothetical protein BY996DRAFT_6595713 [Phakopsora pachyrhizi]